LRVAWYKSCNNKDVKLKYETGIATLIQFIVLSLLGIPIVFVEIISSCHGHNNECSTNVFLSPLLFLLKTALYGCIALIGYLAQERRSKHLAWLLVAAEGCVTPFALFNIIHDTNYLTRATSLLDLIFIAWVALLAFRLARSKGGRIVKQSRSRKRQRPNSPTNPHPDRL
jgi:hypothetical protein